MCLVCSLLDSMVANPSQGDFVSGNGISTVAAQPLLRAGLRPAQPLLPPLWDGRSYYSQGPASPAGGSPNGQSPTAARKRHAALMWGMAAQSVPEGQNAPDGQQLARFGTEEALWRAPPSCLTMLSDPTQRTHCAARGRNPSRCACSRPALPFCRTAPCTGPGRDSPMVAIQVITPSPHILQPDRDCHSE